LFYVCPGADLPCADYVRDLRVQSTGMEGPRVKALFGPTIYTIDRTGAELGRFVSLAMTCYPRKFVDQGRDVLDVLCGFVSDDVGVISGHGQLLWREVGSWADGTEPIDAAIGDINDDEIEDVCSTHTGYIACYDKDGKELWRAGEGDVYWGVSIVAGSDRYPTEIVSTLQSPSGSGQIPYLEVRDAGGILIHRIQVDDFFGFQSVRWPPDAPEPTLVTQTGSGTELQLRDLQGNVRFSFKPMMPKAFGGVDAARVVYLGDDTSREPYLVVLFSYYSRWQRTSLLVFSSSNELVYHEILAGRGWGLTDFDSGDHVAGRQGILVSVELGRILLYRK